MKRLALVLLGCTSLVARAQNPAPDPAPAPAAEPAAVEPPPAAPEPRHPAASTASTTDGGSPRRARAAAKGDGGVAAEPVSEERKNDLDQMRRYARVYFTNLIMGDARSMVNVSSYPFFLEDKRIGTPDELLQEWLRSLRDKRTDLLTLYDVEILTPAEMEKRYGKPPARLVNFPWKAPNTFIAIGNLSGHASVALIQKQFQGWRVIGYHD